VIESQTGNGDRRDDLNAERAKDAENVFPNSGHVPVVPNGHAEAQIRAALDAGA
jgi:hypothetical protein